MTILVTGANGQLGNEVRLVSCQRDDRFIFSDVVAADHPDTLLLDITDAAAVEKAVMENEVKVIINCAAYTNVDRAEDDPQTSELLNAKAPEILAGAMRRVGGLLVHISTDYVFGGASYNTPCGEELPGNPTGVYGLTKLHGERAVEASGCDYVILRTAWLYSEFGNNFAKKMLELTSSRESVSVVFDQAGTPTYALDLANAVMAVLDDYIHESPSDSYSKNGIYHYSNEGVCSWYDFAYEIARLAGHDNCKVLPCHSSEFPSKVVRPSYSVLDKSKVKKTFGVEVPHWTTSLRMCMNNIK